LSSLCNRFARTSRNLQLSLARRRSCALSEAPCRHGREPGGKTEKCRPLIACCRVTSRRGFQPSGSPQRPNAPNRSSCHSGHASSTAAANMSPATPPIASRWMCTASGAVEGNDVRPFRNHRNRAVAARRYAVKHRLPYGRDPFDARQPVSMIIETCAVELDPADRHRPEL
jgi:hypothetical protein